jgi:fibronectin-binding autotransporter adhesin
MGAQSKVETQAGTGKTQALQPGEDAFGSRLTRGGCLTKWKGVAASYAPHLAQLMAMVSRPRNATFAGLALALGLAAGPAGAAERYWDADGSGPGAGGTGTWNLAPGTWSYNSNATLGPYTTPWDNSALDTAIFQGTGGTVMLGAPITAGSLTFNASGYTIAGTGSNTLTLAGPATTITVNYGVTATISAVIAGTDGLTRDGTGGTLILSGANTFTGDVNINSGALTVTSNASFGNAANIVNLGNAALSAGSSLLGRTVNLTGGQGTLTGASGDAHFTGSGGLSGNNGVALTDNTNNYTGPTTFFVNGGASFSSVGNLGEASALGAPTTVANGTISFIASAQYADSLSYTGSGNTSNRNWQIGQSGGTSAAIFRNTGTGTLTLTGDIAVNTNVTSVFVAQTADLQLQGTISQGGSGAIQFSGTGLGRTIALGGANTYSTATLIGLPVTGGVAGPVTVRASVLADTGANSSFGTGASGGLTVVNGAAVSYTGTGASTNRAWTVGAAGLGLGAAILNDGSGGLTLSGPITVTSGIGSNWLTLGGSYSGSDNTVSGVISGTGDLRSSGTATWVLTGANTRTGTIVVNGGTLRAGNASAFGTTTSLTVNSGTLDLNGASMTTATLEGTGGTVALGSGNLTLNAAAGSKTFAGAITGTGGLIKVGASTLTLTGQSTYTGATSIGGGTLALDFTAAGAPASNIISASSTLNVAGGTLTMKGTAGANSQSFNGLNVTAGNNRISATAAAGGALAVEFGAITRSGGLVDFGIAAGTSMATSNGDGALGGWATVNGTDYAQVSGGFITAFTTYVNQDDASQWATGNILSDGGGSPNTPYFGTVNGNVALGGLKYTAAANSTVTVGSGNTLSVDGTILVAPSVGAANQTIQGGSLTGGAGGSALGVQQNSAGTFTIASTVVDNGGATTFTVGGTGGTTGNGVVALTGANSYTGATTVSGATLAFNSVADGGAASAIGASSAASSNLVLENGTLRYTGGTSSTDRGFTLVNGGSSRTFEVNNPSTNVTFGGQVTSPDNAGFTKTGPGTLTLANANNDYVGVTTVAGGTLSVPTLANGGLPSSIGAASSDPSNLVLQTGGTLQYTGATANSDRGFTLGTGGGAIDVAQIGSTLTMSGIATGPGTLSKNGPGTLVLSGANTFTGGAGSTPERSVLARPKPSAPAAGPSPAGPRWT